MAKKEKVKQLNAIERFVCEMVWGGVPVDVVRVRESSLFENGMERFESGEWDEIFKADKELKKKYKLK